MLFSRVRCGLSAAICFSFAGLLPAGENAAETSGNEADTSQPVRISIPIPVGQDAKGLKIPSFDRSGVIQMEFSAVEALRVSEDVVELDDVAIELFDENGESEMRIELTAAALDLATHILSTEKPFAVRRADFLILGDRMEFDTRSRLGTVNGKVQMIIYDKKVIQTR